MKRCPECRRDYYDDTLLFCLDDGTALLEGPAPGDSATLHLNTNALGTAVLNEWRPPHNNLTKMGSAAMLSAGGEEIVGRAAEIEEITSLLADDEVRLVTLTGIGGTGKTRLAKEVGRQSSERFPGGIFFVELESVNDPAMVAPAIAHALGIHEEGLKTVSDILALSLHDRDALIILDN